MRGPAGDLALDGGDEAVDQRHEGARRRGLRAAGEWAGCSASARAVRASRRVTRSKRSRDASDQGTNKRARRIARSQQRDALVETARSTRRPLSDSGSPRDSSRARR